ncbi:MAG: transposase [candidate division WOR-3 bacterium]
MSNRQLNFMDYYIAQTISPDDPIKQIFDTINWQEVANLKPRLCYLCGFSYGNTPSISTISDFINQKLIPDERILKIFHNLVAQLFTLAKIKQIEIAIDGTHLCAQPHDPEAKWGFKRQTFSFFGYKVILLVSVKEPIFPIAVAVVPGNQSESPQFH